MSRRYLTIAACCLIAICLATPFFIGLYVRYVVTSFFTPHCPDCASIKQYHSGWHHSDFNLALSKKMPWQTLTVTLTHGPQLATGQWGLLAFDIFLDNRAIGHGKINLHKQIIATLNIPAAERTLLDNERYQFSNSTVQVTPLSGHAMVVNWYTPYFTWQEQSHAWQVSAKHLLCQGIIIGTENIINQSACFLKQFDITHHHNGFSAEHLYWKITETMQPWLTLQSEIGAKMALITEQHQLSTNSPQQPQLLATLALNHVTVNDLIAVVIDLMHPLPRSRSEWLLAPLTQHVLSLFSNQMILNFAGKVLQSDQHASLSLRIHPIPTNMRPAFNTLPISSIPTLIEINFTGSINLTNDLLHSLEISDWQGHLQVIGDHYQWQRQLEM